MNSRTLVLADYAVGFANGFGETLFNLFQGYPRERLWSAHPAINPAAPRKEVAQGVAFNVPQRPTWVGSPWHLIYHPVLKARELRAKRRLTQRLETLVRKEGITHVLAIPVRPWIFAVALELRARIQGLKLVIFVMDDWQGHHETHGLLFTRGRRRLLREAAELASARFAVSIEMAALYKRELGGDWKVAHNTAQPRGGISPVSAPTRPHRSLLTGDVNVFRFDAVLAFAEALERHRQRHGSNLTLTIFGDVAVPYRARLAPLQAVKVMKRTDQEVCLREMLKADLLYLPLAFDGSNRRIALYSMPTKLPEYLATGRPVLIHAPATSAAFQLAERHDLRPRLGTLEATELDRFVADWASGDRSAQSESVCAERALALEFSAEVFCQRFQAAFV